MRTPCHLVVGVDATRHSADVLGLAVRLLGDRDGELTVATVSPPGPPDAAAARWLEDSVAGLGVPATAHVLEGGAVGAALHDLAEHVGAEAIVVGSSRRGGIGRIFLGDDAASVVRGAPCAVAIAPSGWRRARPIDTVGVAYDGGPESHLALARGEVLARATGARLRLLHVAPRWRTEDYERGVELLEGPLRHLGDRADGDIRAGTVVGELVQASHRVDLLVVGSRGRGPLRRAFAGSTSAGLLRAAHCPLVVVPRPGPVAWPDASRAAATARSLRT